MKTILLLLMVFLNANLAFSSENYKSRLENQIETLKSLENQGRYVDAILNSVSFSAHLAKDLKVDEVIKQIQSTLNEVRQEVLVQKAYSNVNVNMFYGLVNLFSFHSNFYNVTKIITTNSEEVSQFPEKSRTAFIDLQNSLNAYVQTNELGLAYIKAFTANALKLMLKLDYQQRMSLVNPVWQALQKALNISFYGLHHTTHCITTHRIEKKVGGEASSDISKVFFFIPSFSADAYIEDLPYSETTCSGNTTTTSVNESEIESPVLMKLDQVLMSYTRKLESAQIRDHRLPYSPDWGLFQ
jgi:hypothetical protein